ncbi:MAG: class I SAM-dependent methyltransferase [Myxococcota bacterium]|jgi:tRNA (cmo5U34)-methyltransferase|nr:class I SAM-dependent methyltransferase [Myxococcota bacterium]MEC9439603.1 class I SAM-dependent methyltransferase [Myxococcota bacterium]
MAPPKSFEDAERYTREIRPLIPGYDLIHAMIPPLLHPHLSVEGSRLLVVGCGPGVELVALGERFPGCSIDALEPSENMLGLARDAVARAGIEDRVALHAMRLDAFSSTEPYDAIIAVLVGHLLPDNGERAAFARQLGALLSPSGALLLVDLEAHRDARALMTEAHLRYSAGQGLSEERCELMRERLDTGFHILTRNRHEEILWLARLEVQAEFFRAFGVVGLLVRARSEGR